MLFRSLETSLDEKLFESAGRGMKLTAQGRLVMDCAGEIFSLGTEMLRSLHGQGSARTLRLNIGITDSLPKLVAWRLIRPAVKAFPNLQLSCVEGHAQELLGSLAAGRLAGCGVVRRGGSVVNACEGIQSFAG